MLVLNSYIYYNIRRPCALFILLYFSDGLPARPSSSPKVNTPIPTGTAMYDFEGQTDDDLSFRLGDTIELVEQIDDNWIKGKLNGKVGLFPAGFIEVVVPL